MDERMHECMNAWGCMDVWMDGWMCVEAEAWIQRGKLIK